jgi:hypothetical protein
MGNGNARKSPSGDLYVTFDSGLARLSDTGASLVAAFPYPMSDGVNFNSPNNIAVNDAKQALAFANTNANHSRLVLFDGKSARLLAYFNGSAPYTTASPVGGVFQSLNDLALSESGAVMINANISGLSGGLFYYDGSAWKTACQIQSCRLDGELVTAVNTLRVANDRFCATFTTSNGNQRLDCWDGSNWTNILRRGDFTSDGTEISNIGTFDMNRNGDFAISLNTGLANQNVFLKTADGYFTVISAAFPFADGPYIWSITSVDLRDDRRVYFLAMDNTSRLALYEATPRF